MIHFMHGFVSVHVFCTTIASLVAQKDILGWILQNCADIALKIICNNKATFWINTANDVTLIPKANQIEIHITCISTTVTKGDILEEICSHVLETVTILTK